MANVKYKILPDVSTAEVAFEAYGENYNKLFENAGLALESITVDLKTVETKIEKKLELRADNLEDLLFTFLEELVFLKDVGPVVFSNINCDVVPPLNSERNPTQLGGVEASIKVHGGKKSLLWKLAAKLKGEKINPEKHKLDADIKAVTRHLFKVSKGGSRGYLCKVVLDI